MTTEQIPFNDETEKLEISALRERLKMTYEERLEAHENARQLIEDLQKAWEISFAESQKST
jgi:hypothetical protein